MRLSGSSSSNQNSRLSCSVHPSFVPLHAHQDSYSACQNIVLDPQQSDWAGGAGEHDEERNTAWYNVAKPLLHAMDDCSGFQIK